MQLAILGLTRDRLARFAEVRGELSDFDRLCLIAQKYPFATFINGFGWTGHDYYLDAQEHMARICGPLTGAAVMLDAKTGEVNPPPAVSKGPGRAYDKLRTVLARPEQLKAWDVAARRAGLSWAAWARACLNSAAATPSKPRVQGRTIVLRKRRPLEAKGEDFRRWDAAAKAEGVSWICWARAVWDEFAAQVEPEPTRESLGVNTHNPEPAPVVEGVKVESFSFLGGT
jgi:hypothetical protein